MQLIWGQETAPVPLVSNRDWPQKLPKTFGSKWICFEVFNMLAIQTDSYAFYQ
jgi:hypothetical protein